MRGLILSAGLGERLRPYTLKKAKPAIEFLNIPMLGFPYFWLDTIGTKQFVFNTHYLPETIRHAAMHVADPSAHLHFTHEPAILGSGGGIWNARSLIEGEDTFAVANGDGVILCEQMDVMQQMLDFHVSKNALATILVCPHEGIGTTIPGVWMDAHNEVVNFGKSASKPNLRCLHYASYMLFSKRLWNYLPEGSSNILYDVLTTEISHGEKVYGFEVKNMQWFETGNVKDYLHATRTCLEYIRDGHPLGKSARQIIEKLAKPFDARSDWRKTRLIADSAEVTGEVSGFAVVGEHSKVDGIIENCVVLPEAQVLSGTSHISELIA